MGKGEKRGYDGGKKGIKRHIVTDTMGNLLAIHVHAANIHDTRGGVYTFEKALFRYPSITGVCADGAYRKHFRRIFTEFYDKKVDIAQRLTPGFQVIPHRWKAERTFGWANFSRRLSKDYERTVSSAETMFIISHAHTLLKRL